MNRYPCLSLLALFLAAGPLAATDYHVGPGQPLAAIGDAPWASLAAGDRVLIHWRASPYREKWVINRQGTAGQPIVVLGVPGPGGERPVITGDGAVTAAGLNFWNEVRGVIKVGGSNTPADGLPSYVVIEGLEIRSGRPPFTFTDDGGGIQTYADNAAAVYVEKAEHLVIRNCELHDSGNGLFIGAFGGDTRDILLEGNHFHSNGIVGSAFQHNTYTEALGITYQHNRFGPLRTGADGNNLKDRSAGLAVRTNWIEGGNRQLDLVESDSAVLIADPSYRQTFVYGNVLIEPDGAGNSQIVHYGGDGGNTARYRKGTLHFFHNTVVSTRTGNTTLLRLSTQDDSADVRNSILYVTAVGNRLAMVNADGVLDLSHNWTKAGWVGSHGTLTGTIRDDGTGLTGTDPGFADEATQNFELSPGADVEDTGGALASATVPDHVPARQYAKHQRSLPRPADPPPDLGAFEFCATGECAAIFQDGFESGDPSRWAVVRP